MPRRTHHCTRTVLAWTPDPHAPVFVDSFSDAVSLALITHEFPSFRQLLVLLDQRRSVMVMIADPTIETLAAAGELEGPGIDAAITSLLIVEQAGITEGPATSSEIARFEAMRTLYAAQGADLLDVIQLDDELIRSMCFAVDGDRAWNVSGPDSPRR